MAAEYTVPLLINGQEVRPGKTFDVVSPATSATLYRCASASEADVGAAVEAAANALAAWKSTTPPARRDVLLRAAHVLERRREELVGYMVAETGATRPWAEFNLAVTRDMLVDVAGRIGTALEGSAPVTQDPGTAALELKEPFGVVLAIAPWNAPYILGFRSVVSPLAAGNTAVLKGSELSPRVHWAVCSVLHEAGVPAAALNLVIAERANAAAVTAALVSHPDVKKINFTGSTAVGRAIAKLAGEHLKPTLMELGGKASAIVWEDADLDNAATQCARGALINAGQICMSTERILVHSAVRSAFEKKLCAAIDAMFASDQEAPVLVTSAAVHKGQGLLRDAIAKGASVIYGDPAADDAAPTTRMRPVVLGNVRPNMAIYAQESFCPSVSLIEISSEEEALRIANDTEYGLSAAVFTEDLRRGLRLARAIESGAVHINSMTVHDEPALTHGGVKASGWGRFNAAALSEWVRTKTVTYKV